VDAEAGGYRLPTEDEWEFAARGGLQTHHYLYSGSNSVDPVGWCSTNTRIDGVPEIRTKLPNELSLYDMTGNVWEWCFSLSTPVSPTTGTPTGSRVYRGGGIYTSAAGCAIPEAKRDATPDTKQNYIGLRLSLSIPQ